MSVYQRPLNDNILATRFVENILNLRDKKQISKAVTNIACAEMNLIAIEKDDTLRSEKFRDPYHKNDRDREELRNHIVQELIKLPRIANDDKIKPGRGGARPNELKKEKQAYIITGLPASGKSAIASQVANQTGAFILDCDYAKRKFPEYTQTPYSAFILHEESSLTVFGTYNNDNEGTISLLEYCIANDINMVIPKIGHNAKSIVTLAKYLKKYHYTVHLTLISLDRTKAVQRAYNRYVETKRYVSLGLIFDTYSNNPMLEYYRMKKEEPFDSFGAISTDVKKGEHPVFLEGDKQNPAIFYN